MAIAIHVREDNVVVIYDEDDPRYGVAVQTATDAAKIVTALNSAMNRQQRQQDWGKALMRAAVNMMAEEDERIEIEPRTDLCQQRPRPRTKKQ